jgi:predicted nucleotide-binding protein
MAEKKVSSKDLPSVKQPLLNVEPEEASRLIQGRVKRGLEIYKTAGRKKVDLYTMAEILDNWDKYNRTLLETIFVTTSFAEKYEARVAPIKPSREMSTVNLTTALRVWLATKSRELESIDGQLELFEKRLQPVLARQDAISPTGNKVFIVHGHGDAIKQSVARFLEHLDLAVVILHEQADKGQTLIEKLQSHSSEVDIGYAVVLLTPDDLGKLASKEGELSPRARQNVVFELGYFIAKLGRERVRALYSKGVELPSDYQGVLYTELDDAGAWKLSLATEMKAVGFDIDLNKLAQRH